MTNFLSRLALIALVMQSLAVAQPAQEQGPEYPWDCPGSGYLPYRGDLLISTDALAQALDASEVALIHVGFDASAPGTLHRASYADGHLPGARHLSWADLQGCGGTLAPAERRASALAALGLRPGRRVVLYDTGLGLEAAAAYVALDSLGLADHAALLDGQWAKWVSEGRPLCRWGEEGPASDLDLRPAHVALSRADLEPLLQEAGQPGSNVRLLDARAGLGLDAPVPFLKMPWTANLASLSLPVLRSEEELRRRWTGIPARGDLRVVVAARNWREAAPVYFVAKLLGYAVQVYDGSLEDLTLERGT